MKGNLSLKLADRRILVTGGAGFLGSEISAQLSRIGSRVTVLDNFSSGKSNYISSLPRIRIIKADICDREDVSKAMVDMEIVVHLAALPFIPDSYYYPEEFFRVNTMGSVNLLWQAIQSESVERVVHISTSEVYGTALYTPMDEGHPTLPHSTYAVSKLAADRAALAMHKEHGFPVVVVRPFNNFGPRITQPYIVPEIALQLLNDRNSVRLGNIDSVRDLTYVEDTARGIILSSVQHRAVGETINLGSGVGISIRELAGLIGKILGKRITISLDRKRLRPNDVQKLVCSADKARRLLNWSPEVEFEDGLRRTIEWLRRHDVEFRSPFAGWPKVYRRNLHVKRVARRQGD